MMIALLVVVVIVGALIALLQFIHPSNARHLPGPRGVPLLGYLPWLMMADDGPHVHLTQLARRYGALYALRLGGVRAVILSDGKLIRRVLAMDAAAGRAPLRLTHGVMEGYGLICAQGALWKDQRKFLSTFLRQIGKSRDQLEGRIMRQVDAAIEYLRRQDGTVGDVFYHTIGSFMNALVFGRTYDRNDAFWLWIKHLQDEGIKHFGVAGPINFLSLLRFLPKYKRVFAFIMEGKRRTHEAYGQIIAEMEAPPPDGADNLVHAFVRERALASCARAQYYSDTQFMHLLADVFGAGLHTTLTTLCWYWLHMANETEVQATLHAEIDGVLLQGRRAQFADRVQLPHVRASIAEVQRYSTVVPMGIPHGALADIPITDDVIIPRGTMIIPLQWAVHRDRRLWPDPDTFRIDHFLDADGQFAQPPPDAFMPYQTGKRMCVGEQVAEMMLFLFVVHVLQHFRVTCSEKIDFRGVNSITYCPLPQKLRFTPRERGNK